MDRWEALDIVPSGDDSLLDWLKSIRFAVWWLLEAWAIVRGSRLTVLRVRVGFRRGAWSAIVHEDFWCESVFFFFDCGGGSWIPKDGFLWILAVGRYVGRTGSLFYNVATL